MNEEQLINLVSSTIVPHTIFEEASICLDESLKYSKISLVPNCIALIGVSRAGKTTILDECCAKHPSKRLDNGLINPILRVITPSKPTVKGLVELSLSALGDKEYYKGTVISKTERLKTLIKETNTRMMAIDEFQHFQDKSSNKIIHHVTDWLKNLIDECNISLVVAGLPNCKAVLQQNEQLLGRFSTPIIIPRFDWQIEKQRDEFIGIVSSFYDVISEHFDIIDLSNDVMSFRIYCASGGLIGYISKLLKQAILDAIREKTRTINLHSLKRAYKKSIWVSEQNEIQNPFETDFCSKETKYTFDDIKKIGAPSPELIKYRKTK